MQDKLKYIAYLSRDSGCSQVHHRERYRLIQDSSFRPQFTYYLHAICRV